MPAAALAQALGTLTTLEELYLGVNVDKGEMPLPALHHLSNLTRLDRLQLHTSGAGELPPDLLPALGSLTSLEMELLGKRITWQRPNGSGPALRELTLKCCGACLAPDRLRLALQPVERLNLHVADLEEAQFSVLPQLPHLTSLAIRSMRRPPPLYTVPCCGSWMWLTYQTLSRRTSQPAPCHS